MKRITKAKLIAANRESTRRDLGFSIKPAYLKSLPRDATFPVRLYNRVGYGDTRRCQTEIETEPGVVLMLEMLEGHYDAIPDEDGGVQ